MDPVAEVKLGLTVLDGVLALVNNLKARAGMTADQIIAHADSMDLQNKEDIKALLAL